MASKDWRATDGRIDVDIDYGLCKVTIDREPYNDPCFPVRLWRAFFPTKPSRFNVFWLDDEETRELRDKLTAFYQEIYAEDDGS